MSEMQAGELLADAVRVVWEQLMQHALELAANGPATGINPQVGCVLVDESGTIVAEGWHRGAGTPHAEVAALSSLDRADATGLTAVVSLEPCNHTAHTGPCSEALIAAGISRVVYAVADPGAHSSGGAARLREAGVTVIGGILADETSEAMRVWLTAARLGRPFVTVKWASSLDGRSAAADGTSQWITGQKARQRVHQQRALSDAIVVGTGTVIADNPALTARDDAGQLLAHQPIPIVIGLRPVPPSALVFRHPQAAIITASRNLDQILRDLYNRGIRHVYVEGGPTIASAFVSAGLVDKFLVFLAPVLIGGPSLAIGDLKITTIADAKRLSVDSIEQLGDDLLITARVRSDAGRHGDEVPRRLHSAHSTNKTPLAAYATNDLLLHLTEEN